MMAFLQVFFYSILSAFLMSASMPNEFIPFGSPFLGLFALVPLYTAIYKSKNFKMAGFAVSMQIGVCHLLSSFWLANFQDFAVFTLGASAAWYFLTGYLYGALLYLPFKKSKSGETFLRENAGLCPYASVLRIILFACVWTFYEWIKSTGFLAYPWGTLMMSAYRWKLITQVTALTGVWGLSFLFSLFSAVVGEGLYLLCEKNNAPVSGYANTAAMCITLFLAVTLYGTAEYFEPRVPVKTIDTVIVQQNADSWTSNPKETLMKSIHLTQDAIDEADIAPDLVLWSETSLSYSMPDSLSYYKVFPPQYPLVDAIQDIGSPFIIGAPYRVQKNPNIYANSALYFTPEGTIKDYYSKIHLVPFAESVPYSDKKWMQDLMQKTAGFSSGWASGDRLVIFEAECKDGSTVRFSTPICFEDAFGDVCRQLYLAGSEIFMNITNDSWSQTNSAEIQHFVMSSYRAQEYRTTLVRSTNAGYSVVVDPAGRIIADLPLFEAASMLCSVPVYRRELTIYAYLGDWFPFCVLAFLIMFYSEIIAEEFFTKKFNEVYFPLISLRAKH